MPAEANFFKKWTKNYNYFVETGSYIGDGIQFALDAGYKNILSIEVVEEYYQKCVKRFGSCPNVRLFLGNSTDLLNEMVCHINDEITFWLDGHYFGTETNLPAGTKLSPIEIEIDMISKHPVKTHNILIDDVRLWETEYKINKQNVIDKIKTINSNYIITFETGHWSLPNDILVARVLVS
jgi:hypothetical protein